MVESYKAPTVKKAFQILKLVSESDPGARISDLSEKLKISKSTVHGITSALVEIGALSRNPLSKKFTLGVTLFELGKAAFSRIDLKDTARPVMKNLMEQAQETVFLGVRNGEHVIILDIVESRQDLKITAPVGTRIPLFAGAVGKVILASMTDKEAKALVREKGISKFTENTIIHPPDFLTEIENARQNGFAFDDEEYISGVRAVASSIKTKGAYSAAIWVVGFKPRMGSDKMKALARNTRQAAELIRRRIGDQTAV